MQQVLLSCFLKQDVLLTGSRSLQIKNSLHVKAALGITFQGRLNVNAPPLRYQDQVASPDRFFSLSKENPYSVS